MLDEEYIFLFIWLVSDWFLVEGMIILGTFIYFILLSFFQSIDIYIYFFQFKYKMDKLIVE
jgi:hypothetical protein